MINLSQRQSLQQKLTPQQIQYLQLLQLPVLALEQRIKAELEINPLLEEVDDLEQSADQEEAKVEVETVETDAKEEKESPEDGYTFEDFMNDDLDGHKATRSVGGEEERDDLPQPADVSITQRLLDQIRLLDLAEEEKLLSEELLGNIDEDGYLRRDIQLIVQDLNLSSGLAISSEAAEEVLRKVQHLDPPGIGARSLQECLIVQLETVDFPPRLKDVALDIVRSHFDEFTMKHYEGLAKHLGIQMDELKSAIELIQKLNPKPGEGTISAQQNYIIPDFIVERDDDDFIVTLTDRNVPPLRINKRYKELMMKKGAKNGAAGGVKDFVRKRFEAAKWFIASINQRRDTMMRVMRTIVEKQHEFFETGENLKPMIYKDIAEVIAMDISTISRVVNGKYVQTEYGVFELRHFFSDKLTTQSGEEVSNKEVKKSVRELIEAEDPNHPMSDDRIAELLNSKGLNIARRTVAKYREAMKLPVARLRRKL